MKTLLAITLAAITSAHATSLDVFWHDDSLDSFAVTMIGTGLNTSITTVSPFGNWSLRAGFTGRSRTSDDGLNSTVEFNHGGRMTWLGDPGTLFLETHGYIDWINVSQISGPIAVSERWRDTAASDPLPGLPAWFGVNPFIITSLPDVTDPSTWTWVAHWEGQGPAVPEGGSMALGFLTLLILPLFYEKLRPLHQRQ